MGYFTKHNQQTHSPTILAIIDDYKLYYMQVHCNLTVHTGKRPQTSEHVKIEPVCQKGYLHLLFSTSNASMRILQ